MSVNKVILIGNCTRDPELRSTKDGKEIASFSLATSDKWTDKNSGERKEKAEFHNISVFGGLVNIVKNYVKKGSKLYLEGKLQTDKYTDKNGVEKYTTKIVLQGFNSTLQLLNKIDDNGAGANNYAAQSNHTEEELNDDIPF